MSLKDRTHGLRDRFVADEVGRNEDGLRTETLRRHRRHRRAHSIPSRLIGGSADDGSLTPPRDDDRPTAQGRIIALFDRCVKRIHIDMYDLPRTYSKVRLFEG